MVVSLRRRDADLSGPTIVGVGSVLRGNVQMSSGLRVLGVLEGDHVRIEGPLIVEAEGQVRCRCIEVTEAIVKGRVRGGLIANGEVHLLSGSRFQGWIRTGTLRVEEGAHIDPDLDMRCGEQLPESMAATSPRA